MEGYAHIYADKLIIAAPDFHPLYERAFETWKEYVVEKERAGKKMATFEGRNKKQEKVEKGEKSNEKPEKEETPEERPSSP